jgi:hypothetical protein
MWTPVVAAFTGMPEISVNRPGGTVGKQIYFSRALRLCVHLIFV